MLASVACGGARIKTTPCTKRPLSPQQHLCPYCRSKFADATTFSGHVVQLTCKEWIQHAQRRNTNVSVDTRIVVGEGRLWPVSANGTPLYVEIVHSRFMCKNKLYYNVLMRAVDGPKLLPFTLSWCVYNRFFNPNVLYMCDTATHFPLFNLYVVECTGFKPTVVPNLCQFVCKNYTVAKIE
jgi:hypothetical protein